MEERKTLGIRAGDTVRVWQKIAEEVYDEKKKETKIKYRLQAFEGLVIATKHGSEAGATFTVRKVTSGVGVEKTYPLYATGLDKIEIIRRSKVRRAKLYYIRDSVSREMKRALRKMKLMGVSTKGEAELAAEAAAAAAAAKKEEAPAEAAPATTE
jgi:large subunit ribosomal protein L19